jgi:hypothetical protein
MITLHEFTPLANLCNRQASHVRCDVIPHADWSSGRLREALSLDRWRNIPITLINSTFAIS